MIEATKVCAECGEEKSVRYFYKHKGSADGYRSECMPCVSFYNRQRERGGGKLHYIDTEDHDENKVWECDKCGYCSLGKSRLEAHMKAKHSKRLAKSA